MTVLLPVTPPVPATLMRVVQGDTWRLSATLVGADGVTPWNWTGWTGRLQIRAAPTSPDPPLADLTAGAGLTLGGSSGTVVAVLSAAATAALPVLSTAVYELKVTETSSGDVSTLLFGTFTIIQGVVR